MSELQGIDAEIYGYIADKPPQSFLLFAGAGSGKTRTLVNVLQEIKKNSKLIQNGKRVAVITFTNAACEEIKHRLQYDSIFSVSTIHSFAWEMIKPFSKNIRIWLEEKLQTDIIDLKDKRDRLRTHDSRANYDKKLSKLQKRLENLYSCTNFIYSPTEILTGTSALNHAEVISIFSDFLNNYALMQKILVNEFPIILIDECQDTQKELLKSLIQTQQSNPETFVLGLFGDLMQRIYSNGYAELVKELPSDWAKPRKRSNYRSPIRIVELINKIREIEEKDYFYEQKSESRSIGTVRLFLVNNNIVDRIKCEQTVREKMAEICEDSEWIDVKNVKTLVLEHAMAAKRLGFDQFYAPLAGNPSLRDSLLQKTGTGISFLLSQFLPLVDSIKNDNSFNLMRILEKNSSLMNKKDGEIDFQLLNIITKELSEKIKEAGSIYSLLKLVHEKKLLTLPNEIEFALSPTDNDEDSMEDEDLKIYTWKRALEADLNQLENYSLYMEGKLGFDTHQGVKGLEFLRVMAILADDEANGFLFKYEKLFGVEGLSRTDEDNIKSGKDNALSRACRLFYVICSRAKDSLAVVIYSKNPVLIKNELIGLKWFKEQEIFIFNENNNLFICKN